MTLSNYRIKALIAMSEKKALKGDLDHNGIPDGADYVKYLYESLNKYKQIQTLIGNDKVTQDIKDITAAIKYAESRPEFKESVQLAAQLDYSPRGQTSANSAAVQQASPSTTTPSGNTASGAASATGGSSAPSANANAGTNGGTAMQSMRRANEAARQTPQTQQPSQDSQNSAAVLTMLAQVLPMLTLYLSRQNQMAQQQQQQGGQQSPFGSQQQQQPFGQQSQNFGGQSPPQGQNVYQQAVTQYQQQLQSPSYAQPTGVYNTMPTSYSPGYSPSGNVYQQALASAGGQYSGNTSYPTQQSYPTYGYPSGGTFYQPGTSISVNTPGGGGFFSIGQPGYPGQQRPLSFGASFPVT